LMLAWLHAMATRPVSATPLSLVSATSILRSHIAISLSWRTEWRLGNGRWMEVYENFANVLSIV
jgi:hypothetical protein